MPDFLSQYITMLIVVVGFCLIVGVGMMLIIWLFKRRFGR